MLQPLLVPRRDSSQQLIREGPAQGRSQLGDFFCVGQPIQPGHQGIMECRWNGQRRQRAPQLIVVCLLPEQARLEHHLGQLFYKQWHSIGLGHNLLAHLNRQVLAPRHSVDHLLGLHRGQTV
jgi:hypothetical protein